MKRISAEAEAKKLELHERIGLLILQGHDHILPGIIPIFAASITHKMRTLTIYTFEELSDEAKAKAIKSVRTKLKEDGHDTQAYDWAVDDCALFEPAHKEMAELLGEDYYEQNKSGQYGQFVFKNNRKGIRWNFWSERAQIASALEITNDRMFKTWLGIPEKLHRHIDYLIDDDGYKTTIDLVHSLLSDNPLTPVLEDLFKKAQTRFGAHMETINNRIALGMKDYYADDEMEHKIEEGDWEFIEDGSIY